jgi:hypothetical protein
MDEETLKKKEALRTRFQYSSEKELEAVIAKFGLGSLEGQTVNNVLTDRRRELRRSARIIAWATVVTAIATVAAALAAWTAIWFQYGQTRATPNESHQSITTTPSPAPTQTD